jgi:HEAT repeat protein
VFLVDKELLLKNLESNDYIVQKEAIRKLVNYNEPIVIDRLVQVLLNNQNKMVEDVLLESLKQMGGSYLMSAMLGLLGHGEAYIRNFAFEVLMAIGGQDVELIIQQTGNEDRNVRKFIVDILGSIGDKQAVGPLVERLEDEDVNVVQGAVEALGNIGDNSVAGLLVEMLPVSHQWVQYTILDVLSRIGDSITFSNILNMPWETETGIYGEIFKIMRDKGDGGHVEDLIGLYERIMLQLQMQVVDAVLSISRMEEVEFIANILNNSDIIYNLKSTIIFGEETQKNKLVSYIAGLEAPAAIAILGRTLFDETMVSVFKDSIKNCTVVDDYHINLFKCVKFFDSCTAKDILADVLENGCEPYVGISLDILKQKHIYDLYPQLVGLLKKKCRIIETIKLLGSWPDDKLDLDGIYHLYGEFNDEARYYVLTEILLKSGYQDQRVVDAVGQLLENAMLQDSMLINVIGIASDMGREEFEPLLEKLIASPNMDISIAAIEAAEKIRWGINGNAEETGQ